MVAAVDPSINNIVTVERQRTLEWPKDDGEASFGLAVSPHDASDTVAAQNENNDHLVAEPEFDEHVVYASPFAYSFRQL